MKILVAILSILLCCLGYFMYIPLPPTFSHPWRTRMLSYGFSTMGTMAFVVELFGGQPAAQSLSEWSNRIKIPPKHFPELEIEDRKIDGIPVRIYRHKKAKGLSPAVIYIHGGGWTIASVEGYDGMTTRLALKTGMTVISVDYRLSPKYLYPIPFEDCLKATMFVLKHGDTIGVDSKKVTVAGDSAGGNLAAAVSLRVSQEDPSVTPHLHLQVLICPVLQAMTFNTPSYREAPRTFLSQEIMIFLWASYLGIEQNTTNMSIMKQDKHVSPSVQRSKHGSFVGKGQSVKVTDDCDAALSQKLDRLVLDPYVAPLMADDLSKVPPAYVLAMEFDQLKDDAVLYAKRLKESGVSTDLWLVKGHGHTALSMVALKYWFFNSEDYEVIIDKLSRYIVEKVQ